MTEEKQETTSQHYHGKPVQCDTRHYPTACIHLQHHNTTMVNQCSVTPDTTLQHALHLQHHNTTMVNQCSVTPDTTLQHAIHLQHHNTTMVNQCSVTPDTTLQHAIHLQHHYHQQQSWKEGTNVFTGVCLSACK